MPLPTRKEELERIGAERLAASREADRDTRREFIRALAGCVGSCLLGVAFLFFAFAVNDAALGRILLWGGMVAGYSGMFYALASAYRRGQERGDW